MWRPHFLIFNWRDCHTWCLLLYCRLFQNNSNCCSVFSIYVPNTHLSTLNMWSHMCRRTVLWSKYHDIHPQLMDEQSHIIFNKLPQITQLVSGMARIHTQPVWLQSPWFNHWNAPDQGMFSNENLSQVSSSWSWLFTSMCTAWLATYRDMYVHIHMCNLYGLYFTHIVPFQVQRQSQFSFKSNRWNSLVPTNSGLARIS